VATALGRRIPDWRVHNGWAAETAPADAERADPGVASYGPSSPITLVPYGCSNLRIAEFPPVRETEAGGPR